MPVTRNNIRLKHQLFTGNGTWVVPEGVNVIWVDGCGGGGGGGGGDPTPGGGGSGGGAATGCVMARLPVTPGETLSITVGSGANGGAAGADGNWGGASSITGSSHAFTLGGGGAGFKGTPSAGAAAMSGAPFSAGGSTQWGPTGAMSGNAVTAIGQTYHIAQAGSGGALNVAGGISISLPMIQTGHVGYPLGGTGGSSGGGGGAGGSCTYGMGGNGGSNGGSGQSPATARPGSYGSGGGGGSGNAAGGNGAPGFIRIYWEG